MIVSDSFTVADWSDPGTHPGRPIAGLHLHRSDDEAWIVLEGRLGFRVGEDEREVLAGDSALTSARCNLENSRRQDRPGELACRPPQTARRARLAGERYERAVLNPAAKPASLSPGS